MAPSYKLIFFHTFSGLNSLASRHPIPTFIVIFQSSLSFLLTNIDLSNFLYYNLINIDIIYIHYKVCDNL